MFYASRKIRMNKSMYQFTSRRCPTRWRSHLKTIVIKKQWRDWSTKDKNTNSHGTSFTQCDLESDWLLKSVSYESTDTKSRETRDAGDSWSTKILVVVTMSTVAFVSRDDSYLRKQLTSYCSDLMQDRRRLSMTLSSLRQWSMRNLTAMPLMK